MLQPRSANELLPATIKEYCATGRS